MKIYINALELHQQRVQQRREETRDIIVFGFLLALLSTLFIYGILLGA